MSKCSVHGKIKLTASLVATVCVPAKLGHVFTVESLGCAQKSFGEVAKFPFWARTKLHKHVLQKMATPVYYATHYLLMMKLFFQGWKIIPSSVNTGNTFVHLAKPLT